jgi:hypothetical protein
MKRDPPELNLKIGPFSVSAKGLQAVRAIRWPIAFAIVMLVPLAVILTVYGFAQIGVLGVFSGGGGLSGGQ